MKGWIRVWKKRIRTLVHREAVERELDEELAFHLEMETEKNLREGMSPEEARRQAALKFGGVERYKEKVREARVLGWVSGTLLDFKLGFRMLLKYPGLTFAGGLGIAVAIAIAGGFFTFSHSYFYPTIPLPEGDRLVGLENWDMSAFADVAETLIGADGTVEEIRVAHMTPSGFVLARVPPLLGRTLVDGDMEAGSSPVIVIGYDVWNARFAADPDILGTDLLGEGAKSVPEKGEIGGFLMTSSSRTPRRVTVRPRSIRWDRLPRVLSPEDPVGPETGRAHGHLGERAFPPWSAEGSESSGASDGS